MLLISYLAGASRVLAWFLFCCSKQRTTVLSESWFIKLYRSHGAGEGVLRCVNTLLFLSVFLFSLHSYLVFIALSPIPSNAWRSHCRC